MSRSTSPPLRQRLAACAILCGATLIGTWPVFSRPWRAPTYWLTDNPVLAYQLALFLSAVTCGFLFYVLVDRWTFSPAAGVAAGVVSILAPFHLETLRVLLHYAIPYIPAALLCVD